MKKELEKLIAEAEEIFDKMSTKNKNGTFVIRSSKVKLFLELLKGEVNKNYLKELNYQQAVLIWKNDLKNSKGGKK